MRKIINGKIYDTKTADCIAEWSNHYTPNDFHYCEESLYRTKKGNWFLAGEGGALSKYARPVQGGSGGGEGLTPLTSDEARQWLEDHGFTEELEQYFADSIEEA